MAGDKIMLVTEFMPRGDLWRALAQDRTGQMGWYNRCSPPPAGLCGCCAWADLYLRNQPWLCWLQLLLCCLHGHNLVA